MIEINVTCVSEDRAAALYRFLRANLRDGEKVEITGLSREDVRTLLNENFSKVSRVE